MSGIILTFIPYSMVYAKTNEYVKKKKTPQKTRKKLAIIFFFRFATAQPFRRAKMLIKKAKTNNGECIPNVTRNNYLLLSFCLVI